MAGRTLVLPLGCETVRVRFTATMRSVRFSLRTRDPAEAKARQGQAAAALERFWVSLRTDAPAALSHQQATALAGELYRAWSDGGAGRTIAVQHMPDGRWERARSMPAEEEAAFASARGKLEAAIEADDTAGLEPTLGPLVDRLLLARGVSSVDADSRAVLLDAFARALRDAFAARERNAGGDYSPDPNANRFPEWQTEQQGRGPEPAKPAPVPAGKTTLTGLVADWWTERQAAGLKPSTHESYRNTVAAFVAYLKHDDAGRVTAEDVLGFKDHRLATINPRTGKTISAKTVKDSDIAGLKAIFAWAVANRRMASNPAKDVTLKLGKARKLRSKGLSDAEAHAILRAALAYQPGKGERPQTAAAKRWVPWLAAYTGARVGELAQLRKQDLRQQGPYWLITITPEAGTVKTNEAREVVLHPHLVELGFPEFVAKAPAGHLFLKLGREGDVLGPLQGLKNRLTEFARSLVPDPNVAPNHGWRHRFKTEGLSAGMGDRVLDAIQGHAPRTAGGGYGEVTVKAMAEAVAKLPRYEVS
ncbi:DUF6538 domain-containing protein [Methylobacterium oryzihabitans]|uniref:DUF6538 domain-containing protein n=1 Tax=Methylobacterium oryzihabitans TaxID=2499852 RepID=UPI00248245EC|nr:DUF6538 domain-containing protein [Methylobacterium oryzihabitans]